MGKKLKLGASLTYQRFLVGDDGRLFPNTPTDDLTAYRFQEIDRKSEAELSVGWVELGNAWAVGFAKDAVVLEDCDDSTLVFRLRIDALRVPKTVLDAYVDAAVELRCAQMNRDKLSKREVEQITVETQRQLRNQSLPAMTLVPVVWDAAVHELRVFSGSSAIAQMFCELFEKTFGRPVQPVGLLRLLQLRGMSAEQIDRMALLEPERFHLQEG